MNKEEAEGLPLSPEGVPRVIPIAISTFKNPEINGSHISGKIKLNVKKLDIRFYCTRCQQSYLLSPLKEGDLGLSPIQLMTEALGRLPRLWRKHHSTYSGI